MPAEPARSELGLDYRKLYDFAPVIWMVLDTVGIVLDINAAGGEMLGANTRFIIGTPFRMWLDPDHRLSLLDHLRRCRQMGDPVETTVVLASRPRAEGRMISLHSRRMLLHGETVFPTVGIDVSENAMLERARLAAERQRDLAELERQSAREAEAVKDRLIATVSHELRNPLSPALFAASMLCDWPGMPDRARGMAAVIKRNIELEARLIDDLLDFARVTRGQMDLRTKPVNLHDILHHAIEVCAPAAAAKNLRIVADCFAASHHVLGDPSRLEQVFWNLLNNAIKFSPRDGKIVVRTTSDGAGMVHVTVQDFGCGMDDSTLRRLFSPFAQPHTPAGSQAGLGLGLTIARGIVELHEGSIWASSDGPGCGAVLEVDLATIPPPAQAEESAGTGSSRKARAHRRLLIVENHEDTGAILVAGLTQRGYLVTHVRTLSEGLALVDNRWDVVISDIGLDDGSGLEMARQARALTGPLPQLIALSGYGADTDVAASRDAGFDEHVVKPVEIQRLVELIEAKSEQLPAALTS